MANHFDRDIEVEKYGWEQSTAAWSAIQEDDEGIKQYFKKLKNITNYQL